MPNPQEPMLTWKHGGGLVPPPLPEETDATEATASQPESQPGPAPAKAAAKPAGDSATVDKAGDIAEPTRGE